MCWGRGGDLHPVCQKHLLKAMTPVSLDGGGTVEGCGQRDKALVQEFMSYCVFHGCYLMFIYLPCASSVPFEIGDLE
jgi:hypothetical protein